MKPAIKSHAPRTNAFTLIEILVVISIIALLVAILLPGLKRAREQSQTVVCRSNMKQIVNATLLYTQDYGDQVMPVNLDLAQDINGSVGAAWARVVDPSNNQIRPGLIFDYIDTVDEVFECPSNRREKLNEDQGENMFGGNTPLDFDYTMAANMQGARTDRVRRIGYVTSPERWPAGTIPPATLPISAMPNVPHVKQLSGTPVFMEENTIFFNQDVPDGLWSNADQIETRHNGSANVAYLEGHVEPITPLMGPINQAQEPEDLDANDFYVRKDNVWVRIEYRVGTLRPYGWINKPEP